MDEKRDLTKGNIINKLIGLALPIIGTSFIQMTYNLTDMFWIGKLGTSAVAGVGTAGFYTWLAIAFIMVSQIGAEVRVAQSAGKNDTQRVRRYSVSAFQLNTVLAIGYGLVMWYLCDPLIGFFALGEEEMIRSATVYLQIAAVGMLFYFMNPVFTGIFNGIGDSKTPFIINTIGLGFNMVFDPILILGLGGFPKLGVTGAALATVGAQIVVSICFVVVILKKHRQYIDLNIFKKPCLHTVKDLSLVGLPAALQGGLFTLFSMALGRIVADFGAVAIAVQKIGSQVEAISWRTAGGLATALGSFTGQNYGAKEVERMEKGYRVTMTMAMGIGVFATFLLIFGGEAIFKVFLPHDQEAIKEGNIYLIILGLSQLFMCIEITSGGFFNGLGRTQIPSIVGIVFTGARIPMALVLSSPHLLGLQGIWWSISITSIIKGIVMVVVYYILKRKNKLILYSS